MKKLFVCLTFLICFDYIYPACRVLGDGDNVKKDECLKRKVEATDYAIFLLHVVLMRNQK